jgi:hypothetical protein
MYTAGLALPRRRAPRASEAGTSAAISGTLAADGGGRHQGERVDSINLQDTGAWRLQVVAAFVISLALTTGGVFYLPASAWVKGYLLMGVYFTVSSAFGLAKTLRDAHESHRIVAKISEAKTEKMLRELAQV